MQGLNANDTCLCSHCQHCIAFDPARACSDSVDSVLQADRQLDFVREQVKGPTSQAAAKLRSLFSGNTKASGKWQVYSTCMAIVLYFPARCTCVSQVAYLQLKHGL